MRGAKSESEQQTTEYKDVVSESIREGKGDDVMGFMESLAKAAEEKLTLKPPMAKKRDCRQWFSSMQTNSFGTGRRGRGETINEAP